MAEQISRELEKRAVRACRAAPLFARITDGVLAGVRRALGVPEQAEPDVEQEFSALRARLEQQYTAEFERLFAALLTQQLGRATSVVLSALECELVQAYLAVAEQIDADVSALVPEYIAGVGAALSSPARG